MKLKLKQVKASNVTVRLTGDERPKTNYRLYIFTCKQRNWHSFMWLKSLRLIKLQIQTPIEWKYCRWNTMIK